MSRRESRWTPSRLISDGVAYSSGRHKSRSMLTYTAERLAALEGCDRSEARSTIVVMLDRMIDPVFEHGWQPSEVLHAGRRVLDHGGQRLLLAIIGGHAHRWSATTTVPEAWATQLNEMGADAAGAEQVRRWETTEPLSPVDVWVAQLSALGFLSRLPPLAPLMCVPSGWSSASQPRGAAARPGDDKVLAKIRGLLAKAESTSFAAEAEALSAKAQDLMTRHAIDTAMVESSHATASDIPVDTRRLLVDSPYSEAKASVLNAVARSNGVRAVSIEPYGIVTVIGMPVDLDFCELLFTSLLVQASRAMRDVGVGAASRTTSFRRSFLYAFADGIGARLATARDEAAREASNQYGAALVPVLDARAEAVDTAFREQFPQTTRTSPSVSNRAGWVAGRVAADQANLSVGAGRIDR